MGFRRSLSTSIPRPVRLFDKTLQLLYTLIVNLINTVVRGPWYQLHPHIHFPSWETRSKLYLIRPNRRWLLICIKELWRYLMWTCKLWSHLPHSRPWCINNPPYVYITNMYSHGTIRLKHALCQWSNGCSGRGDWAERLVSTMEIAAGFSGNEYASALTFDHSRDDILTHADETID